LVLVENNLEHFTAHSLAHWHARNIGWESWSLSVCGGENITQGRRLALLLPALSLAVDSQGSTAASASNFESYLGISDECRRVEIF